MLGNFDRVEENKVVHCEKRTYTVYLRNRTILGENNRNLAFNSLVTHNIYNSYVYIPGEYVLQVNVTKRKYLSLIQGDVPTYALAGTKVTRYYLHKT